MTREQQAKLWAQQVDALVLKELPELKTYTPEQFESAVKFVAQRIEQVAIEANQIPDVRKLSWT